jgi:hypothetical protein
MFILIGCLFVNHNVYVVFGWQELDGEVSSSNHDARLIPLALFALSFFLSFTFFYLS